MLFDATVDVGQLVSFVTVNGSSALVKVLKMLEAANACRPLNITCFRAQLCNVTLCLKGFGL